MDANTDKNMTYEEAVKELEKLVIQLEKNDNTLEETIKLYDEATKLSGYCSGLLDSAKLRITELSQSKEK